MTESVQNIQKKTLLDNSQCNKVNKDNLKNKGKHTFDGIGMCGVGVYRKFIFVRLSHRLQLLPTI